ncbi:MAG: flavodoxin family protein [Lachnospiraceae bacterium]|nr:flavodoxin family protein [Lachnospiraceae bacterium]
MKFVIFNGSPSGKNSATNALGEAFLSGAAQAGAEVQNIFLVEKKIGYCQGCFSCWFKTPGKCVIRDDMQELIEKYMNADVVCLATPVFTWNMTANLKAFVDRLAPLKSPRMIQENNGFDLADAKAKSQKFVVLSNCGFPGSNNFETLKTVMATCNPVLEIYRNCGKLLKSTESAIQEIVQSYLKIVEEAGYEMAATGAVSIATRKKLDMELMPVREYVKYLGM